MKRVAGNILTVLVGVTLVLTATAYADAPLKSTHFEIDESVLGGGGLTQEQSNSYNAGESIGDLTVGNSASSNFQVNGGYETTSDPALTFIIDSSTPNFGSFSPTTAAVATSTFEVIDYTSYGYIVQIAGTAPTNGSHVITPMTTTGPSQAGVEQFGINLVANTSPVAVGANPNNGQFGYGTAASDYSTANQYRYVSGETIAAGPKSSGDTVYTISYLVNVSSITPGGQYTSGQTLVCTGTF